MGSIRRRSLEILLVSLVALGLGGKARANAPEDQFGLSARINAMGGAGTALATDPSALYYNPGGLGFCTESQVMLDVRQNIYNLHASAIGPNAPKPIPGTPGQQPNNQTRGTIAGCLRLPRHFAVGVMFGTGVQAAAAFSEQTPNDSPQWAGYSQQDQLSINVGLAYRPIPELSIGAGGSIIINTDLAIVVDVPVGQTDPVTGQGLNTNFDVRMKLAPTGAPYVGIMASPTPDLKFGLTYRGKIQMHLNGPLGISAQLTLGTMPVAVDLPMLLTLDSWYSPQQIAGGGAWTIAHVLTLAADVTWYQYSQLTKSGSTYPYLNVESTVPGILLFNPINPPLQWHDVYAFRLGGELKVMDGKLGLRAGYQFRTQMVSAPGNGTTSLLDSTGARAQRGHRLFVRRAPTGTRAAAAAHHAALPSRDASRLRRRRLDTGVVRSPSAGRIDAFARAMILPSHSDTARGLAYGGQIYDGGMTLTLGWY